MRDKLWNNYLDIKFKSCYYLELLKYYKVANRRISIFLAIVSSSSIASWAIWEQLHFISSFLIAASTVVSTVIQYFPFNKYISEITRIANQLELLSIDYDVLWFKYYNENYAEETVFEKFIELQKREHEILQMNEETILNDKEKIIRKANDLMDLYLKHNFNIQHNSNKE